MTRLVYVLLLAATAWAVGFAPDQRHLAPNRFPYTALGRTLAHGGLGCAVLVGPDLVLTCGHCVSDPENQVYDDVEIEFGLGFEPSTHKARVKEVYLPRTEGVRTIDSGEDWAIVRLDRPLGAYYGWVECAYLSDSEWRDADVELVGYCLCPNEARPEFGCMDRPYRCAGAVSDVGPWIIFHNCAMWGGTSGAPMLARIGDGFRLVAVNFAGVNVEQEVLQNGFRDTYRKELANLAIPARNWREQLVALKPAPVARAKEVFLQNRAAKSMRLTLTYHSVFDAPDAPPLRKTLEVPAGSRRLALERSAGCADSSVTVQLEEQKRVTKTLASEVCTVVIP